MYYVGDKNKLAIEFTEPYVLNGSLIYAKGQVFINNNQVLHIEQDFLLYVFRGWLIEVAAKVFNNSLILSSEYHSLDFRELIMLVRASQQDYIFDYKLQKYSMPIHEPAFDPLFMVVYEVKGNLNFCWSDFKDSPYNISQGAINKEYLTEFINLLSKQLIEVRTKLGLTEGIWE